MSCDYRRPSCSPCQQTNADCIIVDDSITRCEVIDGSRTLNEELEAIHKAICTLKDHTDTSNISVTCDGELKDLNIKECLTTLTSEVCSLKDRVVNLENKVSDCGLYYGNLLDTCVGEVEPANTCELYQFLLNRIIDLTAKINK